MRRRDTRISEDLRQTQDALKALRQAYRKRELDGLAPADSELAALEDDLDAQSARTLDDTVVERARGYRTVGRAYASKDPEIGVGAEEVAYDRLSDAIRLSLKKAV